MRYPMERSWFKWILKYHCEVVHSEKYISAYRGSRKDWQPLFLSIGMAGFTAVFIYRCLRLNSLVSRILFIEHSDEQVGLAGHIELAVNVLEVGFHRIAGDVEGVGNFRIVVAAKEHLQDIQFAGR